MHSHAEIVEHCLSDVGLDQPPNSFTLAREERREKLCRAVQPDSHSDADELGFPLAALYSEEDGVRHVHVVHLIQEFIIDIDLRLVRYHVAVGHVLQVLEDHGVDTFVMFYSALYFLAAEAEELGVVVPGFSFQGVLESLAVSLVDLPAAGDFEVLVAVLPDEVGVLAVDQTVREEQLPFPGVDHVR